MSEPLVPPTPPAPPAPPAPPKGVADRPGNPWDRRSELGFAAALWETIKVFVTSPVEAFAQTRERGDYGGPLLFAIIIGWVCAAIGQLWQLVLGSSFLAFLPGDVSEQLGPLLVTTWAGIVFQLLLIPIYIVISLFIASAILHLCAMIVGVLTQSQSGFEGTFRTISFSTVASFGQIIPLVGGLVSIVWSFVLLVIGLTSLHRTTTGKAALAVLIPVILCCVCVALGIAMFGAALATFVAGQQ